ncbi:TrmH family RNA methyltransferase [Altericista sp. CCNU0014]|uniref:TrmH family RNA methyltransferase n=1 Tax=Altericista sp. CCNU0014 TaxID=3082949 RepID=UPI00385049B3
MLTSLQNPLVKQVRKLRSSKHRRLQGCFLLEGTHLLQEAALARWPLVTLFYTERWQDKNPQLLSDLQGTVPRCELASAEVLAAIATTLNPDGVVAVAQLASQRPVTIRRLGLVLETLQDPGNVGTLLRTAAAAGVEGVLLSEDSADLESPKVLRASAGAWFKVAAAQCANVLEQVKYYQSQGFQAIATTPRATIEYWSVDYTQPTLILVGNEGAGLSEALLQVSDVRVSIPTSAGVESLNAAIATAVLLYEAKRQRAHALARNRS